MRIGINIASYLPLAAWFPGMAVRAAKEAGYEFLQAIPLRGMALDRQGWIHKLFGDVPVEYVEDTWNTAVSLIQVLKDKAKKTAGAPTLLDYAIFPSGNKAEWLLHQLLILYSKPGLRPRIIDHNFSPATTLTQSPFGLQSFGIVMVPSVPALVEVHPGLWMTRAEIVEKAAGYHVPKALVPDLWHLRHEATPEWIAKTRPTHITVGSLLGPWQESLPQLLPYSTAVHVSPSRESPELQACLRGEDTELGEMIDCICESGWDGDLIVEATLGLKGANFGRLSGALTDFRGWLVDRVNQ